MPRTPTRTPPTVRPLLMRIHFYAGLLVGPFLLLAATTGMLYALTPTLERVAYHDQLYTETRGKSLPLAQQLVAARTVEPNAPLDTIRPAPAAGRTTLVRFDDPALGPSQHRAVFVDPVSGEVRGSLVTYGRSAALPLRAWIDGLHRNLHLGDPGRSYSELAASWLWVLALGGPLLWWAGRRGSRRRGTSASAPDRTGTRRRTRSWHAAVGITALLGMLMLSATGLTWSQFAGANVSDLRTRLGWQTPPLANDFAHDTAHHGGSGHRGSGHGGEAHEPAHQLPAGDFVGLGPDTAARAAVADGLTAPLQVRPPHEPDASYIVSETSTSWPASVDTVAVDAHTGRVKERVDFDDWPLAARLARWGIQLHMGFLFGAWNQVGLVLLAGGIGTLVVSGYRMWWLRRPTRGHRLRFARPLARGAWRRAPVTVVVALVITAIGVGWFLPMFGMSLLGFLAVDAVVGLFGRRGGPPGRPRAREPDQPVAAR